MAHAARATRPPTIALLALAIVLALSGCLRNEFDLCEAADPHPECDAGPPPQDAGPGASDAGGSEDAGMNEDSGVATEDSGAADAGVTPEDASSEDDAGMDAGG